MLLAYAGFVSVAMVSECEGSFGGPTTSYSRFWLRSELGGSF